MEERADPATVALDDRDRLVRHEREVERAPVAVDPPAAVLQPEREPERRVAERVGDRVPQRRAVLERDHQPGDRASREPAAQDPEQERERHRGEEQDEQEAEDRVGRRGDPEQEVLEQEQQQRRAAARVDGQKNLPGRRRRRAASLRTRMTTAAAQSPTGTSASSEVEDVRERRQRA